MSIDPSVEANKKLVRRFVREVFEQGGKTAIDELVADDFVAHAWPSVTGNGKQDLKLAAARMSKALADVTFRIDDLVGEDDRVVVRLTARSPTRAPASSRSRSWSWRARRGIG